MDVPFTVTPPISRIDPPRSQTLRIVYTGEALWFVLPLGNQTAPTVTPGSTNAVLTFTMTYQ
jgi:P pilus assembly chaperone PapD